MGSVGLFDLFVTNVEKEGIFLKVWGQKDHASAVQVERLIQQHFERFERGEGLPDPKSLQVDMLCCARYSDGAYYRARILDVNPSTCDVACVFIDYGNKDRVPFSSIRVVDNLQTLFRIPAQASPFILTGVVGTWDKITLQKIMDKIGYEELKCMVLKAIGAMSEIHLLKVYCDNQDYAELLVRAEYGKPIGQEQFEVMIWTMLAVPAAPPVSLPNNYMYTTPMIMNQHVPYIQHYLGSPSFVPQLGATGQPMSMNGMPFQAMPNGLGAHPAALAPSVPVSVVPSAVSVPLAIPATSVSTSPVDMRKASSKTAEAPTRFKPIHLQHDSEHKVFVSHVDKGTFSFAVQLSENDSELERIVTALNNPATKFARLKPGTFLPGTICLAKYSEDDSIYRAVITEVLSDKCSVYFVDYGNSDAVRCHDLFEISAEFTHPTVMAVQFTLAGLSNTHQTDEMLQAFYDLVFEKDAVLKVVPPKCEELVAKQLGELFIDDTNVKELINIEILKKRPKTPELTFRNMPMPEAGSKVKVVVAYVKSLDNFYVQLASNRNDLDSMMAVVAQHCNGPARRLQESEIRTGAICCALFDGDNQWYRAMIYQDDPSDLTAMYVDYGNEEKVKAENLRNVDENIANKLRTQAIPCRLAGFDGGSEELVAKFEELVLESQFVMHVINLLKEVPCLVVRLFDENGNDVAKQLSPPEPVLEVNAQVLTSGAQGRQATRIENQQMNDNLSDCRPSSMNKSHEQHEKSNGRQDSRMSKPERSRDDFQKREESYERRRDPEAWGIGKKGSRADIGHCDRTTVDRDGDSWGPSYRSNRSEDSKSTKRVQDQQSSHASVDTEVWNDKPQTLFIESLSADVGCRKPVSIVFATNPSDFYINERPTDQSFQKLMEQIESNFEQGGELLPASCRTVGAACVAKYSEDDAFYRARILKVDRESADVFFVDYGNLEKVNNADLRRIEPNMVAVKGQAIHCKLMGVPQNGWSDDKVSEFTSLLDLESLEAEFLECTNNVYSVILKDTSNNSIINELFGATAESMLCPTSIVTSVVEQPTLTPGMSHNVLVSWCETPGRFFIQLKESEKDLYAAMTKLQKDYKNSTPLSSPSIGQVVVALFKSDGALYRGLVKIQKGNKFGVQFIDYGNRSLVDPQNIYGLQHQHSTYPASAILCSLHGVLPASGEWVKSPEISSFFDGSFTCTFVKPSESPDVPHEVSLSRDGQDLADLLISKEFAKSDVPAPVKVQSAAEPVEEVPGVDPKMLVGQLVPAKVVGVEDGRLFVAFEQEALSQMRKDVASSENLLHLPPDQFKPGVRCIVLTSASELRRAIIIDSKSTVGVAVRFMDYGEADEYSCDKLFVMPSKFGSVPSLIHDFIPSNVSSDEHLQTIIDQDVVLRVHSSEDGRLTGEVLDLCGQGLAFSSSTTPVQGLLPMAILKRKLKVSMTHASGSTVWLQQVCQADTVSKLLDDLFEAYEEEGEPLTSSTAGTLCAAKSTDENWYRAVVEDVSGEEVLVRFTDYGNTESLPLTNLKSLDKFFNIPTLAVRASLPVISRDAELGSAILDIAGESDFMAVFVKNDQEWLVELLDADGEFSMKIIRTGKALSMEKNPFPAILAEPEPSLEVGNILPATLSYVVSYSEFYVHLKCQAKKLEQMQEDLQTVSHCMLPLEAFPEVGSKVMALFSEDGVWYRGEVMPEQLIHFLDYGNDDSVTVDSLKVLPPAMESVPRLSTKCSLAAPVNKQWSSEATDKLPGYLEDDFTMTIKSVQGDTCIVQITNSSGVCISELLAQEGYVKDLSDGGEHAEVVISSVNSPSDFWVSFVNAGKSPMHCALYLPSNFGDWSDAARFAFKSFTDEANVFQMVTLLPGNPTVVSLTANGRKIDHELISLCSLKTWHDAPVEATVVYSNSPSDFFIHLSRDSDAVEEMASKLEKAGEFDECADTSVGTVCASLFGEDELWYRAKILGQESEGFLVEFIDYGNTAVSSMVKALPHHLRDLPPLALHCTLSVPDGCDWSDAAREKFEELTQTNVEIELLSSEEPFVANMMCGGHIVVHELAKLSGIDLLAVDELLSALKRSMTIPSPLRFNENEVKPVESLDQTLRSLLDEVSTNSDHAEDLKLNEPLLENNVESEFISDLPNNTLANSDHTEDLNYTELPSEPLLENNEESELTSDLLNNTLAQVIPEEPDMLEQKIEDSKIGSIAEDEPCVRAPLQEHSVLDSNFSEEALTERSEQDEVISSGLAVSSAEVQSEQTCMPEQQTENENTEEDINSSEITCLEEYLAEDINDTEELNGSLDEPSQKVELIDLTDTVQVDIELQDNELGPQNESFVDDLPVKKLCSDECLEDSNSDVTPIVLSNECLEDSLTDVTPIVLSNECLEDSVTDVTPTVLSNECLDDSVVDITPAIEIPVITIDDSLEEALLKPRECSDPDHATLESAISSSNDVVKGIEDPCFEESSAEQCDSSSSGEAVAGALANSKDTPDSQDQLSSTTNADFSEVVVSLFTYPSSECCEMDMNGKSHGHCVACASDIEFDLALGIEGSKVYVFNDCEEHSRNIVDIETS